MFLKLRNKNSKVLGKISRNALNSQISVFARIIECKNLITKLTFWALKELYKKREGSFLKMDLKNFSEKKISRFQHCTSIY